MKINLKLRSITAISILVLSFIPSTGFGADNLQGQSYFEGEQKALRREEASCSSMIPLEVQNLLIREGYGVLRHIYSDNYDVSQSGLYDKIYPHLEPILKRASCARLVDWDPVKPVRWLLSSADQTYITARKNQMVAIIALIWAITDLAKQQNDFFERGSFTIIDPDHRLTQFFLSYVKLTTGHEDPQKLPFALTTSNFAYRRDPSLGGSSHHKGRCPESQFGVDVRFETSEAVLKLLPFDNTHILFAQLGMNQSEPLLFLKPEDIGIGSLPAIMVHGFKFLHSQSHVASEARREKDIRENIREAFEDFQTTSGIEGQFNTIRAMYLEAERFLREAPSSESVVQILESAAAKAQSFMDMVNFSYPNKNNHLRVGNEVILDLRGFAMRFRVAHLAPLLPSFFSLFMRHSRKFI